MKAEGKGFVLVSFGVVRVIRVGFVGRKCFVVAGSDGLKIVIGSLIT